MVHRSALQVARAAAADAQEFRCFGSLFAGSTNASESFLERDGDRAGHAFAGLFGQSLGEFVSFGVFDVQAHLLHRYRMNSTIPYSNQKEGLTVEPNCSIFCKY